MRCFDIRGEEFPAHTVIVVAVSPFFKTALCGDFKEGTSKMIELNGPSPASMSILLDFAYGEYSKMQLQDFSLRLDVWQDAHCFGITPLWKEAAHHALHNAEPQHMVDLVHHAELYGTEAESGVARRVLVENVVKVAEMSSRFGALSFRQLLNAKSSQLLVAYEDEILDIVNKWVGLNDDASKKEVEELYGQIRLERLRDRDRAQKLSMSPTYLAPLARQAFRLYFHASEASAKSAVEAQKKMNKNFLSRKSCVCLFTKVGWLAWTLVLIFFPKF